VYEATGKGAIAVEEVPRERVHLYGIVDARSAASDGKHAKWGERLLEVRDLVEKPQKENAPSNLAVTGRYVLPPEVFDALEVAKPGAGGEIQLTDALCAIAKNPGLYAFVYEGRTYDAGDKLGFLEATVQMALRNPDFGGAFKEYLKGLKL
jgi:UTP--glucose-1-phosphate uridylyltransferase